MLSQIQRLFLFIYYFFYNLFKGKEEWKCDNDAEKKPTKACCTPVQHAFENNQQLNLKESKNFLSTPRPYVDPLKKSWWQWTKDCVSYGWQKFKNAFNFSSNTRYSTTFGKWLKFIPAQIWRGIKWIFYLILSGLVWILRAFMQIFRSHEATKTEEVPKQYVYKKIESPRDYLNYDDDYAGEEENKNEEKKDDEKMVEKNFKNDAKDEITLDNIQKGPKEAIISLPQVATNASATAAAFSHGQFTAPESHVNQESPISFYARRVSIASSKSGEQQQQIVPSFSSPPPPAPPPPPKSAIRIPTTVTTTTTNNENTKESKEKTLEASVKGGVSVIVPGLMDAAKESIERRKRGRTLSPENKNKIINSGPAPYRSPSVFGTSTFATTTAPPPNNNRINTTMTTNNHGIVTRMNAQTPTSDTFLFRPRSQTARNMETTTQKTSEDYFHPNNHQSQQQRMFSTSPTPSGTFLLGQSVFKPVNEVEKIRDNFNRKCESRGVSVAGGYSRSPSVMSQSYHDGAREYDNYTPYRDSTYESSNALRHRFPMQTVASSNDYPTPYGQTTATTNHKWNIRNNATSDDIFNRLPSGATRRVNELKVTEKHIEKDVDGQVLSGWREQNWMGTYEKFENPNPIL